MVELIYIDEQRNEGNKVVRSAVSSGEFSENQVAALEPLNTLDETIEKILEYDCKVLITDYLLAEHNSGVEFSGTDLIIEFQRRFAEFPCFVTTTFSSDAVNNGLDVNIIFPKSDFLDREDHETSELPFFTRVRNKISSYETRVSDAQELFHNLSQKAEQEQLSASEIEDLIRLDNLIESLYGNEHSIEGHIKEAALVPFGELIQKTESLVEKIEAELDSKSQNSSEA